MPLVNPCAQLIASEAPARLSATSRTIRCDVPRLTYCADLQTLHLYPGSIETYLFEEAALMIKPLHFASVLLLIAVLGQVGALAQNDQSENDGLQACATNAGSPRVLFRRHFNTLVAPDVFDSVHLTGADGTSYTSSMWSVAEIIPFPDVRFEKQIEVFSMPRAMTDQRTVIEFRDSSGEVVSSCFVVVVEYDAAIHDASQTVVGYCDFGGKDGVSRIQVGEARTVDLPEKYLDGAISPRSVLDYKPERGARQVTFTGHSAGFATFIWLAADTGKGMLRGVCPFFVEH